jgi:AraC-like DNA-binding protein
LDDQLELRTAMLPLHSAMVLMVNDILSCSFRGGNRRAYMRAKSLELLSTVIHALGDSHAGARRSVVKLSTTDLDKISLSRSIMASELEHKLTLAQLARRVGLNRTKLALGFKEVYGTSVQAFWRDAKLSRARELLRAGETRVTEVALRMGYSELSSFTRAFGRKFGVLPRACRG